MGKFVMPTVQQFLQKKRLYSKKKDLEWEYIEQDMLANIDKKPYNKKVHVWLQFLKELRHYYRSELKKQENQLIKEAGPPWYVEFSGYQKNILANLKSNIHQDILEDLPRRTRKALSDIGLSLKLSNKALMSTMKKCEEDPGVFLWLLYKQVYKSSPSELKSKYDMNAMILMSSIVAIDLEECLQKLEELTHCDKKPVVKTEKVKTKYYEPKGQYGVYLQKMYVPCIYRTVKDSKPKPLPLGNKLRLRSRQSYETLLKDESFLRKRLDRNIQEKEKERICTYKFWEPPSTLRNRDPKLVAFMDKLKMFRRKAKVKFTTPYKNIQFQVGNVAYSGGKPNYIIANVNTLPTGYIHINGGQVMVDGCAVTVIAGYWKYPVIIEEKCESTCDCLEKWEESVMGYLKNSKCKCGHLYDFYNEGKPKEKYIYPPNKHGSFWIDRAKIFQMDSMEDFIRDTFIEGVKSKEPTPCTSEPTVSASGLKTHELAAAFLADLSDTALMIPHLPQANFLNNIQEWVRKRVKGPITPKASRRMLLQSQRRWLTLKHLDHRARAYSIPFTQKELAHFNWSQRYMVQKLFCILMEDFVTRNRLKQIEQTRMWWSTMKFDCYPNKPFLDIFFTYLPGRMQDTYFINPYSSHLTPKDVAKTCPLRF